MVGIILRLAINAAAVWLAVVLVDGLGHEGEWWTLVIIAAVLAVLNTFVKPILKLLSLPVVILTLGLFLLVLNALMLQIVVAISDATGLGLTSTGFFWATFLGAIVISIASWIGESITGLD
jgi:putative membrane protein